MGRPVYAIFVAGGSGSRMGTELPKQFLKLDGTSILRRTIERFLDAESAAHVITVLPRGHIQTWKEMCIERPAGFGQTIVAGGMTRFHSVQNALAKVPDGAIVAVHDGVRPLFTPQLVRNMLDRMESCPALVPAVPVTDTLRFTEAGVPAPDRSKLCAVQTPQMFWSELLKKAYRQPYDTAFTDDASVAERAGIPIEITPGERYNIKITTPEDLPLASALLRLESRSRQETGLPPSCW